MLRGSSNEVNPCVAAAEVLDMLQAVYVGICIQLCYLLHAKDTVSAPQVERVLFGAFAECCSIMPAVYQ